MTGVQTCALPISYARKIDKAESRLDFSNSSQDAERQVRAFNPSPGAFFEYGGERIRVHTAALLVEGPQNYNVNFSSGPGLVIDDQLGIGCRIGALRPTSVQRAGRGFMDTLELLRGFPIPKGAKLT